MKEITRKGCGAPDCIYNEMFRCTLPKINVDEGSRCLTFKRMYRYRFGG